MELLIHGLVVGISFYLVYRLDKLTYKPLVAILLRWIRWVAVSILFAYISQELNIIDRPFGVLLLISFLGWFLLETVYNWIVITAISKSQIPLFPKYNLIEEGDEWPIQKEYDNIRDWLKQNNFTKVMCLKATLTDEFILRQNVFESIDKKIRLQVLFLPHRSGNLSVCFVISSISDDGLRLITDNYFMPFGGFYPENWYINRKLWMRSLPKLFNYHTNRMKIKKKNFIPWNIDPLKDINDQQRILDNTNTELGFLFPNPQREDYGKITREGRYRVWKELWLLNYFGITFIS